MYIQAISFKSYSSTSDWLSGVLLCLQPIVQHDAMYYHKTIKFKPMKVVFQKKCRDIASFEFLKSFFKTCLVRNSCFVCWYLRRKGKILLAILIHWNTLDHLDNYVPQ